MAITHGLALEALDKNLQTFIRKQGKEKPPIGRQCASDTVRINRIISGTIGSVYSIDDIG